MIIFIKMVISQADLIATLNLFTARHPDLLVLGFFGSYAKGTAKAQSDVDICLAEMHKLSSEKKITLITELSILLKKEVDLIDLQAATGVILKEALHTAVWIKKDSSTFAQILKRMLYDQADFQPYYDRILKAKRERFLKK